MGIGNAEAEAAVRQAEDLIRGGTGLSPPGVGDDDDLELQALCRMDGEQPHRVGALFLGRRLLGRGSGGAEVGDEANEALDVGPAQLLERARHPRQLAHVGVALTPVPLRQ